METLTTTTTTTITVNELLSILSNVDKPTFINLVTETLLKMNKKNNPYSNIIKRNQRNFLIGNSYENRVNNNMKKEGLTANFDADKNKIGVHSSKCVLFNEVKNTYYLQVETFDNNNPIETFFNDGIEIDKTLFVDYLPKVSNTSRQEQENKVTVKSYNISNIKQISINGKKYQIV